MKHSLFFVFSALSALALAVSAQEGRPDKPRRLPPPPPSHAVLGTPFIERQILNPHFCKANAITEGQVAAIRSALKALDVQSQGLEKEIISDAKCQADLVKSLLSGSSTNAAALDAVIEKIGKARTEQAKLTTRRLLILRNNLSEGQRKKAVEQMVQEHERRRKFIEKRRQELEQPPAPKAQP